MTAPHYIRPAHHELPKGSRLDGLGHDGASLNRRPRPSTAPAGLFAPAPEVVVEKVVKAKSKPKAVTTPKPRYQATLADGRPSRAKPASELQRALVAAHGTISGYHRHLRVTKTPACDECKAARAAYQREQYAARNEPKRSKTPPVCGTTAAYRAHRTKGEPTCEECKEANRVYQRDMWAKRAAKRKGEAA